MDLSVYMAGPITGLTKEEWHTWRIKVTWKLEPIGIETLDPTLIESKEFAEGEVVGLEIKDSINLSPQAIFNRDLLLIRKCDILLVNYTYLPENSKYNIGTPFELGFAYSLGKTIVVVSPDEGLFKHPFISQTCIMVKTIDEAIEVITAIYAQGSKK